jgi:hypothetical protein
MVKKLGIIYAGLNALVALPFVLRITVGALRGEFLQTIEEFEQLALEEIEQVLGSATLE